MFGRKRLEDENTRLRYRVAELEERLCPCESHIWRLVNSVYYPGMDAGSGEMLYTYKCRKCGKIWETNRAGQETEARV